MCDTCGCNVTPGNRHLVTGDGKLADNLKALSIKALNVNSPYSDNTTGTVLRWNGN